MLPQYKFLGVIIDKRLDWKEHTKNLKEKCSRQTSVVKSLPNSTWEANRQTLLKIINALVLSRLDYGCQAYASANETTLHKLEPVINQTIRIAIGAHRTSPMVSILAEAGACSLFERREFVCTKKLKYQKGDV